MVLVTIQPLHRVYLVFKLSSSSSLFFYKAIYLHYYKCSSFSGACTFYISLCDIILHILSEEVDSVEIMQAYDYRSTNTYVKH